MLRLLCHPSARSPSGPNFHRAPDLFKRTPCRPKYNFVNVWPVVMTVLADHFVLCLDSVVCRLITEFNLNLPADDKPANLKLTYEIYKRAACSCDRCKTPQATRSHTFFHKSPHRLFVICFPSSRRAADNRTFTPVISGAQKKRSDGFVSSRV